MFFRTYGTVICYRYIAIKKTEDNVNTVNIIETDHSKAMINQKLNISFINNK